MNVRLASVTNLTEGTGTLVEALGHRIALFLIDGDVYAIGDRCSHAEASLAEGEVFGFMVECPRHGSEFDVVTGTPHSFPATKPVPVYEVTVVGGEVFADLEPLGEEQ
jgi:3-phenylpropionate/trans-cinnamate dioxygenase ferredoxin subunit